jgi:hypothetical protein
MKRKRFSIGTAFATLLSIGGCVESIGGSDVASIEQFSFGQDLGVGLGSPVTTGNTSGKTNDFQPSCIGNSAAPDLAYIWTAPAAGSYVFSTLGSTFDTVLEVREYNTTTSLGCNDDSNGTLQSTVGVSLPAGQTVLIVVDGFGAGQGPFQLNITAGGGGVVTAGLHLWLRADAGVFAPGGIQVSQWLDQSGNGRNASMATPARRPQLVPGVLHGLPVIRFSGAQSMSLDTPATPQTFTIFAVGKNTMPSESFSMILGPGGSSPNNQLRWENGSQALFVGAGNNLPTITSSVGNTRVYHALSARYDGAAMTVYRDGNATSSHAFTTTDVWTLASVGSWYSSYFLVGDLAEVIIYDRALSESEYASMSSYLRDKYDLP